MAYPLPISHIYMLATPPRDHPSIVPMPGLDALRLLRRHTYRLGFLEAMGRQAWHLQRISKLANRVRVAKLHRPATGFAPGALVDAILADLG